MTTHSKSPDNVGSDASADAEDQVGYRKPPRHSRFKPGQSGNPGGRRRGTKNRESLVKQIADEIHVVVEKGRRTQYTTLDLLLITLRNLALKGNARAGRLYDEAVAKHIPQPVSYRGGFIIMPETLPVEEWLVEAEKGRIWQNRLNEAEKAKREARNKSSDTSGGTRR